MVTMAQLILCNRIHRLDQRAARWLLQVDERVEAAPFGVTQDFLAQMIGVQRPALSVAMRQFKEAGLVTYSRGQISIADRDGLLARSCGCIRIIASEADRLRDTPGSRGSPLRRSSTSIKASVSRQRQVIEARPRSSKVSVHEDC
jgi:hypothetical protein